MKSCELANNVILRFMDESVRKKIDQFFSIYPEERYKKGSTILRPEEPLVFIYTIVSGYIKSYSLNDEGLELVINIYNPYNFFPITETLSNRTNTYFFEAITDVVLHKAPTHKVHEFIRSDQEVLYDLTRRISSGLEGFMVRTQYLIRSNATQKIASSLVMLARRFGENTSNGMINILLPQTHADIANLSGVSRETASIELKKLEEKGLISTKRQIYTVRDFEKLKEESTIYYEDQPLPFTF
jgi:CRP/FNR family transcriptional regulator